MLPTPETCYAALTARDPRFDGLFFVGVATTGIYCRPVCTAKTPGADRCTFFASSAAAEREGFRACFVCRPELAPGHAPVDAVPSLVTRAAELIRQGYLNDHGVTALAAHLAVSPRHLRRAFEKRLGVSPNQLAQSQRLGVAKLLLQDSGLGLADIAFASGFGSVRRFNAAFAERFGRPPSAVRRRAGVDDGSLTLRLDARPPFDWPRLLAFLASHGSPGVEHVDADGYHRVVHVDGHAGVATLTPIPDQPAVRVVASLGLLGAVVPLVAQLRRLLDLDARPDVIGAHLCRDPWLAERWRQRPGLRVAGCLDPFELLVRTILGQQVTVKGATTLAGRLVVRFGAPLHASPHPALTHRFPTAAALADATPDAIAAVGLPGRRAETIGRVARCVAERDGEQTGLLDALAAIPGIGPWTLSYLAMRGLGDADAFPDGDLVLRRAMGDLTPARARARAEPWRPWRAYAVMTLWTDALESRT